MISEAGVEWLVPDWPAPPTVRAAVTLRAGGVSRPPYDGLNLATHVGDLPEAVAENRRRLALALPGSPCWLDQSHGGRVVEARPEPTPPHADGSFTQVPGRVCAVLTADCLPILLCRADGSAVAALHGGWRGLAGKVVRQGVAALAPRGEPLLAWIGPGIESHRYRVGKEVRVAFLCHGQALAAAFTPAPDMDPDTGARTKGAYHCDLVVAAQCLLAIAGVTAVYRAPGGTFEQPEAFYSHRRDGGHTGRFASLIWLAGEEGVSPLG
jgi:hypothetical protein